MSEMFEYQTIALSSNRLFIAELNAHGTDGWELVHIVQNVQPVALIFKRRKRLSETPVFGLSLV